MIKNLLALLAITLLLSACGGNKAPEPEVKTTVDGLTPEQLELGIGPITSLTLGPLDMDLAAKGKSTFEVKCSACHKIEERHVGPALKGVTQRRKPEYIMNMILNPEEMVQKHPEVKKLLAQYYIPMTFQNVSQDEARSILEYFRSVDEEKAPEGQNQQ